MLATYQDLPLKDMLLVASDDDPKTYKQVMQCADDDVWDQGYDKEMG